MVGVAISRSCSYNRRDGSQLSEITNYVIGRIIKQPSDVVQERIDDLERLGWLFDTGKRIGARKVLALSFSLLPLGNMKT